jgi:peptidoglycan/LPS O-acetylase OafA/YrhL
LPYNAEDDPNIKPKYRPDIDGLRAVAVVSVLLFHAFPDVLRGGFVGVDIFFCISGFLISSILISELRLQKFSLIGFYNRRVRRIFPALLTVLVAVLAVAPVFLAPDELKSLGLHTFGGASFLSNFILLSESGYFDTDALTKPLLHLWSLAVEEQFYIFWPLLLAFSWRWRWGVSATIAAVALLSFLFNLAVTLKVSPWFDPSAGFYLPMARFWELMGGAWLAYEGARRSLIPKPFRDAVAFFGSALLIFSIVAISGDHAYPSVWALFPTVGALCLIAAGAETWVSRVILSNKAAVWIGLISYPLYLWHWPLLAFARVVDSELPSMVVRASLAALAVPLAWLTYRFIERPVRSGKMGRMTIPALAAGLAIMGVFGGGLFLAGGGNVSAVRVANRGEIDHPTFNAYLERHFVPCDPPDIRAASQREGHFLRCTQSRAGDQQVAIIGDSHAEQIFLGLAEVFPEYNSVDYTRKSNPADIRNFGNILRYIASDKTIKTVIFSNYWAFYVVNTRPAIDFAPALLSAATVLERAGKHVIILDDPPNFSFDPARCKYERLLGQNRCSDPASFYSSQRDAFYPKLQQVAHGTPSVSLVDTWQYFCRADSCQMARGGEVLYRDRNHINIEGSRYLARRLRADHPDLLK